MASIFEVVNSAIKDGQSSQGFNGLTNEPPHRPKPPEYPGIFPLEVDTFPLQAGQEVQVHLSPRGWYKIRPADTNNVV